MGLNDYHHGKCSFKPGVKISNYVLPLFCNYLLFSLFFGKYNETVRASHVINYKTMCSTHGFDFGKERKPNRLLGLVFLPHNNGIGNVEVGFPSLSLSSSASGIRNF